MHVDLKTNQSEKPASSRDRKCSGRPWGTPYSALNSSYINRSVPRKLENTPIRGCVFAFEFENQAAGTKQEIVTEIQNPQLDCSNRVVDAMDPNL